MKKYLFIGLMVCSISGYADTNTANHQTSNTNDNNLLVQLVDTKLANMQDKLARVEKSNQDSIAEVKSSVDDKLADKFKQLDDRAGDIDHWFTVIGIIIAIVTFVVAGVQIISSMNIVALKKEADKLVADIKTFHQQAKNKSAEVSELVDNINKNNGVISPKDKKKVGDSAEDIQRQLTPEEWFVMGLNAQQNKQYYDAITYYGQAIELFDSDVSKASAYNNRGHAKSKLNNYNEAIQDYDEAIRLNPKNCSYYYNRGIAKGNLGKYGDAIEDYNEAIRLNPQKDGYYFNRGNAKAKLNNYDEAIQDYSEAIKLNPKDDSAYYNRGNAKCELKRYKEAIEDFDNAIKINPQFADAHFNKAYTYALLEKKQLSLQSLDNALKLGYTVEDVSANNVWREYLNDADFKALINKYNKDNHAKQA